ncbi:hypothetical protein ACHAXS_004921 [Conticribra weissflogii]
MSSKMKALSKRRPKHNIISMILGSVKEKNRQGHSAHGSTSGTSSSQSNGHGHVHGSSGRRPREGREASPSSSSRTRSTSRQPSGSRMYDASRKNRILATAVEMTRRTKSRNNRAASASSSSSRGGALGSSLHGGGANKRQLLKGQRAYYKSSRGIVKVTVVGIHHDSKLEPYYTIKLKDGKEKQTDGKHLIPMAEESASSNHRGEGNGNENGTGRVHGTGNGNGNSNEGAVSNSGGREKSNHGTGNDVVTDHMSSSSSEVDELLVLENHNTKEEQYVRARPALPAPATEDHHSRSSASDNDRDQDPDNASNHYNHPDSTHRRRRISRSQPAAAAPTVSSSATPSMSAALQASTPGKEPDTPPYRKHQEAYYRDVVPTPTSSGMTMQTIVTKAKILEIYTDLNNKLFKHSYMIQLSCDGSKKEVRGNKLCMLMDLTSDELAEVMKEKNSRCVTDGTGSTAGGSVCGGPDAEHTIGAMGTAASKKGEMGSRRGSMPEIHKLRRHCDSDGMGRLSKSTNSAPGEGLPQQDTIDEGYEAEEGPFSSGSENSDSSNEMQNGTGTAAGTADAGTGEIKNSDPPDVSTEKKEDGKFLALPCAVQMVQANTEDGGTKIVPRYEAGMDVYYKGPNGIIEARILESHLDDLLDPYYTVRLEDGREKQTDNAHITLTKEEVVEEQALVKAGGGSDNENGDNGSEGGVEDEQTLVDPQMDRSLVPLSKNANSEQQHCLRPASSSYNNHELVSSSKKQDPSASVNIGALVKFSIGEEVHYNSSQGEHLRATVIKLLKDKKNRPYYVVRLQGGKEKQVYGHRLSPCAKSISESRIVGNGRTSYDSNNDHGGSTTPPKREPTRSRSISRGRRTSINGSGTNDAPPSEQSRRRRSFVRSESISSRSSRRSSSRRDASEDSRKSRPTSQEPSGNSNNSNNAESSSRGNRGHSVARRSRSKSVRSRRDLDTSGHGPDRTNSDRGHSTSRRSRSRAPSDSNLAMSTRTYTDRRPTTPGISHTSRIIYPPEEGGVSGSRSEKTSKLGGFRKSFSVGRSK